MKVEVIANDSETASAISHHVSEFVYESYRMEYENDLACEGEVNVFVVVHGPRDDLKEERNDGFGEGQENDL
jgi:hypothetical protein